MVMLSVPGCYQFGVHEQPNKIATLRKSVCHCFRCRLFASTGRQSVLPCKPLLLVCVGLTLGYWAAAHVFADDATVASVAAGVIATAAFSGFPTHSNAPIYGPHNSN